MSVRINLLANLLGRSWAALMSFAFVPLYLRFLGVEAYGLVGFFATLMGTFVVLDLGLSITVNREFARLDGSTTEEARTLLRSLELVYWIVAVLIAVGIFIAAPAISQHWLNTRVVTVDSATSAVRLMGCVALFRWPVSLYLGALSGLRRQVLLNLITSTLATLSGAGAVVMLWLIAPRIEVFFWWQVIVAGVQVLCLRTSVWRLIALPAHRTRPSMAAIRQQLHFSGGVTGIALVSTVLTQFDKLAISKLLSLQEFGYYALATSIAAMLMTIGASVESAAFPALANLYSRERLDEFSALYHRASNALAILVIPAAAVLALFAPELLRVYLQDPATAARTQLLLSLLVIGNAALAMMFMPLALQLASGWTRLSLIKNMIAVVLFVPAMLILIGQFGAAGAAMTWIALTACYLLIEIPIMHRRLLPGEQWRWYFVDVGMPLAVSLAILLPLRLTLDGSDGQTRTILVIMLASAAAFVGAVLTSADARKLGRAIFQRLAGPL